MSRCRPLLAGFLALTLALTSAAMAAARGQTMAAGSVVICTGSGAVTMQVDADGQPVGPVHICPDCALSLLEAAAAAPEDAGQADLVTRLTATVAHPATVPHISASLPPARAPPPV